MCDTESALLAAIAAAPTDQLPRGVLADWLDDEGRHDEADAVRATKAKVPKRHPVWNGGASGVEYCYSFAFHLQAAPTPRSVPIKVWIEMRGSRLPEHQTWKDYPSFTLALLDLIRAWCAVHRSEVPSSWRSAGGGVVSSREGPLVLPDQWEAARFECDGN